MGARSQAIFINGHIMASNRYSLRARSSNENTLEWNPTMRPFGRTHSESDSVRVRVY